jgi:hypothetical protein
MESMEPPWSFAGVYMDSMWTSPNITLSLLGIYMDFIWSLVRVPATSYLVPLFTLIY